MRITAASIRAALHACLRLPWFGPHRTTRPGAQPWPLRPKGYAEALGYQKQALRLLPGGRLPQELPPLQLPLPPAPRQEGEAVHLAPPAVWVRRGVAVLFLLLLAGTAKAQEPGAAPRRPAALILGEQSLLSGWPAEALRHCRRAAAERGPHRAAALLCQGRAALRMRWGAEAARLARAALREPHYPPAAHVLLGDALRLSGGGSLHPCPNEAVLAYRDAQAAMPEDPAACAGLRACSAEVPASCPLPAPGDLAQVQRQPRRRAARSLRRRQRRPTPRPLVPPLGSRVGPPRPVRAPRLGWLSRAVLGLAWLPSELKEGPFYAVGAALLCAVLAGGYYLAVLNPPEGWRNLAQADQQGDQCRRDCAEGEDSRAYEEQVERENKADAAKARREREAEEKREAEKGRPRPQPAPSTGDVR